MKIIVYLKISLDCYIVGKVVFQNIKEGTDEFLFNHLYHLTNIEGGKVNDSKTLDTIYTQSSIIHQNTLTINWEGYIDVPKKTSQIKSERYLEIGLQSGLIPMIIPFQKCSYEYHVEVPDEFVVAGFQKINNQFIRKEENTYEIALVVFHQDDMQIYTENSSTIYARKYHSFIKIKQMANITSNIFKSYQKLFGSCEFQNIEMILNPRFDNGAYARENMIFLVDRIEGDTIDTYMHIAHEISHLWWKNSDLSVENDWINETFAQYSALMLVRKNYGQEVFQLQIDDFMNKTRDFISLSEVDQNTPRDIRYAVHYQKGPYLFSLLEKEIGEEEFILLFRECFDKKIKTSQEFLTLVPSFQKYFSF